MNDGQITESFNTLGNVVELATMIISKVMAILFLVTSVASQPPQAYYHKTIAAKDATKY